jgi:hypothetical protein
MIVVFLFCRSPALSLSPIDVDGYYGAASATAVEAFQSSQNLSVTGVFEEQTAMALLDCCEQDGYVDDGAPASVYGSPQMFIQPSAHST